MGIVKRGATDRQYLPLETLHAYHEHLRDRAAGRSTSAGASLADERAALAKTQREIEEIKLAKMRGEVLDLDETSEAWGRIAATVRGKMLSLSGRVRAKLSDLTPHHGKVIDQIVRDDLNDIADEVEVISVSADAQKVRPGGKRR